LKINIRFYIGVNIQEENLMNMLFGKESQYNALITPISNSSEPLDVYFGLNLAQIINVYEKEQIVKVNVWLQLRWYDYQMKWNPDRFGLFKLIIILIK
jgi:nicotinic acetylcholine receptor